MRSSMLDTLLCPYCANPLEVRAVLRDQGDEILDGIVGCSCAEYPIVEGILCLLPDPITGEVLSKLREGNPRDALSLSLAISGRGLLYVSSWARQRGQKAAANLFRQAGLNFQGRSTSRVLKATTFCGALRHSDFDIYLRHRFSAGSFWPVYAIIPLLKQRNGTVLDLGCGGGHASFVISRYVDPKRLICADRAFWELFLARRFMAPRASFVQLEAAYSLPFRDGALDCVFSSDMVQYVDPISGLLREIQRAISQRGLMSLLHLHNALSPCVGGGRMLSPPDWIRLFGQIPVKAFSESRLVEEFMLDGRVDLSQTHRDDELQSANALCFVASEDSTLFRAYDLDDIGFPDLSGHLRFNPIYDLERSGETVRLVRRSPSSRFKEEYPLSFRFLPDIVELGIRGTTGLVHRLLEENPSLAHELMMRFVILAVPEHYQ